MTETQKEVILKIVEAAWERDKKRLLVLVDLLQLLEDETGAKRKGKNQ